MVSQHFVSGSLASRSSLAQAQRPPARNRPLGLLRLAPLRNPQESIREAYYSYDNGTTQCVT